MVFDLDNGNTLSTFGTFCLQQIYDSLIVTVRDSPALKDHLNTPVKLPGIPNSTSVCYVTECTTKNLNKYIKAPLLSFISITTEDFTASDAVRGRM